MTKYAILKNANNSFIIRREKYQALSFLGTYYEYLCFGTGYAQDSWVNDIDMASEISKAEEAEYQIKCIIEAAQRRSRKTNVILVKEIVVE